MAQAPEPRKRTRAYVAVGSVIVIVVVALVLAQVLYGVFSGPRTPAGPGEISANFGSPTEVMEGFQFAVTSVSQALGPENFKVNLRVDSAAGTPASLATTVPLTVNGSAYTIVWVDAGERTLNASDRFQVIRSGGLSPTPVYTFSLLWSDGSVVQTLQYIYRPTIAFGPVSAITDGFQFSVSSASRSFGPANYKVNLQANSTTGTAVALAASMMITVGPYTYSIAWVDIGGDAALNVGDQFRVTLSGGLPALTAFTFYLLWSDGTLLRTATYTT